MGLLLSHSTAAFAISAGVGFGMWWSVPQKVSHEMCVMCCTSSRGAAIVISMGTSEVTVQQAKAEALESYEVWGHWAIECWDDAEWQAAAADWPEAKRGLGVVEEVARDRSAEWRREAEMHKADLQ